MNNGKKYGQVYKRVAVVKHLFVSLPLQKLQMLLYLKVAVIAVLVAVVNKLRNDCSSKIDNSSSSYSRFSRRSSDSSGKISSSKISN